MDPFYRPTWAEISLDALESNIRGFRAALSSDIKMMAVVKANGYGHGMVHTAQEAVRCGIDYLGVGFLDEAIALRRAGIRAPVLVMGYTPPEGFAEARKHDVTLTIYSEDALTALQSYIEGEPLLKVHVKIDTGMGRIGLFTERDAIRYIERSLSLKGVLVEGLFTHFARADESDKTYTERQYNHMKRIVDHFRSKGVRFPLVHCGNSAVALDTPHFAINMVRLGISMYGLYPSVEVQTQNVRLQPVMRLVTKIIMLKTVPAGTSLSYGGIYTTAGEEQIATIPVGYGDGYSRILTGKACALVRGTRVPVVGRICMDQCMLNVTGLDVRPGDEVVLFGEQDGATVTAEELAEWLGTINYEVTCKVQHRVPRVYMRKGEPVEIFNPFHRQ